MKKKLKSNLKINLKKKCIVGLGICLLLSSLAGCKPSGNNGENDENETQGRSSEVVIDKNQTLAAEIGTELDSLNPAKTQTQAGRTLLGNCFEGLMKVNASGKVVEGQAESYTVSEDGLEYTFSLRKDAKWSDGSAVTAEEFVGAWQQLVKSENAGKIKMVENAADIIEGSKKESTLGIEAVDMRTVKITLAYPDPYFLDVCADPACVPVKDGNIADDLSSWNAKSFVCNGAYVISALSQSSAILSKNGRYYGADEVKRNSLELVWGSSDVESALNNGELFFAESIPGNSSQSEKSSGWSLYSSTTQELLAVCVNQTKSQKDTEAAQALRDALGLAVDRVYIAYQMGDGWSAADAFVPPNLLEQTADNAIWGSGDYEEDLKTATDELTQQKIVVDNVDMEIYTDAKNTLLTELISDMWRVELGIEILDEETALADADFVGYAFICEKTAESAAPEEYLNFQKIESNFYMPEMDNDLSKANEQMRKSAVLIPVCSYTDWYGVSEQVKQICSFNGCRYFMYVE
ncbi:MAG: ABC transporter substrate-binding protein [Lachnospiraceae bacterium]